MRALIMQAGKLYVPKKCKFFGIDVQTWSPASARFQL